MEVLVRLFMRPSFRLKSGQVIETDYYFFLSKHLIFTFSALIIMILISAIETPFLKKFIIPSFIISFILLALVPIIGIEVKGAKRWIDFYFFRLQPIEILKPLFILMTVKIIYDEKNQIGVPESAVTIQGNTAFVYTVNDDIAEKKNIEIKKRNFGKVSVISGLS